MKICVVTDCLKGHHRPDLTGGAESFLDWFILHRRKLGDDLTIITRRLPKTRSSYIHGKVHVVDTLERMLPKILTNFKHRFLPIDPVSFFQVREILKRKNFDAIYFGNFQRLSFSLLWLSAIKKLPKTLIVFDYWYFCAKAFLDIKEGQECRLGQSAVCYRHCEPKRNPLRLPLYALRPYIFRYFLRKFDRLIVLSKHSAGVLKKNGLDPKRIEIGDFFKREYAPPRRAKHAGVLFLSPSYARHKGTHLLPSIIDRVRKNLPYVKCYITNRGDPAYLHDVKQEIKDKGLEEHFIFLGELDTKSFKNLMKKISIVLVPELWPNMCPATALEGLSWGKIVLASKMGGMPEYTTYTAPPQAKAFAKKIEEILAPESRTKKQRRSS